MLARSPDSQLQTEQESRPKTFYDRNEGLESNRENNRFCNSKILKILGTGIQYSHIKITEI